MTKSRTRCGRTTTFGLLDRPMRMLGEDIRNALKECKRQKRLWQTPRTRSYPLKKLRSNLAHVMSCDVIYQPLTGHYRSVKTEPKKFGNNPVWDKAPAGAYYKARRLCPLLQPIVTHGYDANICHDLTRLSINIWRMPKKHFDGLLRRIRSKIASSNNKRKKLQTKSPEAVEGFVTLTTNPVLRDRVYWFTRNQANRSKNGRGPYGLTRSIWLARKAQWLSHLGIVNAR